jgi:hypothetical protein
MDKSQYTDEELVIAIKNAHRTKDCDSCAFRNHSPGFYRDINAGDELIGYSICHKFPHAATYVVNCMDNKYEYHEWN